MTPPKKAAKTTAKKAAKKAAGHHHDKHHHTNDLRRAFEHMGRLGVLRRTLDLSAAKAVDTLTDLAQSEINAGSNRNAADLLRASEHLSFATLADDGSVTNRVSTELRSSIQDHFNELTRKADEHWEEQHTHPGSVTTLYQSSRRNASRAFRNGAFYQALEFARAAEALAHVKETDGPHGLEAGRNSLLLKS